MAKGATIRVYRGDPDDAVDMGDGELFLDTTTDPPVLKVYYSSTFHDAVPAADGGLEWVTAPTEDYDPGTAGQVAYDSSYFYVCVSTDSWRRVAISTWSMP